MVAVSIDGPVGLLVVSLPRFGCVCHFASFSATALFRQVLCQAAGTPVSPALSPAYKETLRPQKGPLRSVGFLIPSPSLRPSSASRSSDNAPAWFRDVGLRA